MLIDLTRQDVTQQINESHERLQAAIAQRDFLIREVHHQIKNNLQGVSSLIAMTAESNPATAQTLRGVASRINAIAAIHGLHLASEAALKVDDIVSAIAKNVSLSWGHPINHRASVASGPRLRGLTERCGVPLALILNELLTNAVRHRNSDAPIDLSLTDTESAVLFEIVKAGALAESFDLRSFRGAASGLGLILGLMPSKDIELSIQNRYGFVIASISFSTALFE